jgi:hypothetical protein
VYIELTNIEEIRSARAKLVRAVDKEFRHRQIRRIGYPNGAFDDEVRFKSSRGANVPWAFSGFDKRTGNPLFFCGRGDPNSNETLNIDLQFNFPKKKFDRRFGGAFVRDTESGLVLLAHRGIVTRGKSRVPKDLLMRETTERPRPVSLPEGGKELQLLIAGPILPRGNVMSLISKFAFEIRRAAIEVMDHQTSRAKGSRTGKGTRGPARKPGPSKLDAALTKYFAEFEGETKVSVHKTVVRNCRHGAVVGALRAALSGTGKIMKSTQIDLVLFRKSKALVFEVKTANTSTAAYTAIGQLVLHSSLVKKLYPALKVTRHIVLPDTPTPHMQDRLRDELGFGVVTYDDDGDKVKFKALP